MPLFPEGLIVFNLLGMVSLPCGKDKFLREIRKLHTQVGPRCKQKIPFFTLSRLRRYVMRQCCLDLW